MPDGCTVLGHKAKKHTHSGARLAASQNPSSASYCVTLGKLLNLSVPRFSSANGDNNSAYLTGLL